MHLGPRLHHALLITPCIPFKPSARWSRIWQSNNQSANCPICINESFQMSLKPLKWHTCGMFATSNLLRSTSYFTLEHLWHPLACYVLYLASKLCGVLGKYVNMYQMLYLCHLCHWPRKWCCPMLKTLSQPYQWKNWSHWHPLVAFLVVPLL